MPTTERILGSPRQPTRLIIEPRIGSTDLGQHLVNCGLTTHANQTTTAFAVTRGRRHGVCEYLSPQRDIAPVRSSGVSEEACSTGLGTRFRPQFHVKETLLDEMEHVCRSTRSQLRSF